MDRQSIKIWQKILVEMKSYEIKSIAELVPFIKQIAIDFIDNDELTIKVNGSILQNFSNIAQKRAFIKAHRKNKAWGNDTILFPFLNALGYRVNLHLRGTDLPFYEVYEPKKNELRTLHIANYGAVASGVHWELLKERNNSFVSILNPGNGDCMYWVLAQAICTDLPKVLHSLKEQSKKKYNKAKPRMLTVAYQEKIKNEWKLYARSDKEKQQLLYQRLDNYFSQENIEGLSSLFNKAYKLCDGDCYIASRVDLVNSYSKEELLHILSMEAWRNPKFFSYLKNQNIISDVRAKKFNFTYLKDYTKYIAEKTRSNLRRSSEVSSSVKASKKRRISRLGL